MTTNRELDKFYTNLDVALECIDMTSKLINLTEYTIIEPSAGSGNFSSNIKNCIALDILPENDSVTKMDWFEYNVPHTEKTIVIGNPPFGKRSLLAKSFIKHSIEIGADVIAFILPNTFSKFTNQRVFPATWKLINETPLRDNSFSIDGDNYHVPCTFYVWTREDNLPYEDLRKVKLLPTSDFSFCKRGAVESDFCVCGTNGKVRNMSDITNPKGEHYIKSGTKSTEELIQIFKSLKFGWKSSVNGGVSWIGQQDILHEYYKYNKRN